MPSTSVLTGERFRAKFAPESHPCVRIHVSLDLVGREKLLLADFTLEEPLTGVHVKVPCQIAQPLERLVARGTIVNGLTVHNVCRDVSLLPYIFTSQTDMMSKAVLVPVILPTQIASQHLAPVTVIHGAACKSMMRGIWPP